MNYKLTAELPKSGKMQVTPEQSEALQKALFDMGYGWIGEEKRTNTNFPFLYWEDNWNELGWQTIEGGHEKIFFTEEELPLCLFEDYFETLYSV